MIACYYGHSDCVRQLLDIEGKIYTPREFGPETSAQAQSFLILLESVLLVGRVSLSWSHFSHYFRRIQSSVYVFEAYLFFVNKLPLLLLLPFINCTDLANCASIFSK